MEKLKYKHSPFDESIFDAMTTYNSLHPADQKFNLIDARILSLVHSYDYSNQQFFGSNKYLAIKCMTTEATVQKSINKLCSFNLLKKSVHYFSGRKQRVLSYEQDAAEAFKKEQEKAQTKI